jgi:hypothetical protein
MKKIIYGALWDQLKFGDKDLVQASEEIVGTVMGAGGITSHPKIWAYLTKRNGESGWQDNAQSALVNAFYLSDFFDQTEFKSQVIDYPAIAETPEDLRISSYYYCGVDNSMWGLNFYEWRMSAEKFRFLYIEEQNAQVSLAPKSIGKSPTYAGSLVLPGCPPKFSAVQGRGPVGRELSVAEWKQFLLS